MGAALAHALVDAGAPLTVWNRTPARTSALESRAAVGLNAAAACAASDVIVLCLSHYAAGLEVLDGVAAGTSLEHKVLVQFTSGTASDARAMEAWAGMHGMRYLDCALIDSPAVIGGDDTTVLVAGAENAWEQCRGLLGSVGGRLRYAGEDAGAASTLACALLHYLYGATLSMLHGAALCESERASLNEFFYLVKQLTPRMDDSADGAREMIRRERFEGTSSPLKDHVPLLRHVQRMSHDNEINPRHTDMIIAAYKKAVASGHGDDQLQAVFEILRAGD